MLTRNPSVQPAALMDLSLDAPASISGHDWNSPRFLKAAIEAKVLYACGKRPATALHHDWLTAAILVVRDRVIEGWMSSIQEAKRSGRKRVYYLSL
jgi:glucan phosphorylase